MNFLKFNGIETFYYEKKSSHKCNYKKGGVDKIVGNETIVTWKKCAQISQKSKTDDYISMNEIPEKMTSSAKIMDTKRDHVCLVCSIEGKHMLYRMFHV